MYKQKCYCDIECIWSCRYQNKNGLKKLRELLIDKDNTEIYDNKANQEDRFQKIQKQSKL